MPIIVGPSGPSGSYVSTLAQGQVAPTSIGSGVGLQIGSGGPAGGGTYNYYPQQSFDTRIQALTFPMGGGGVSNTSITRGFMVWATATGAGNPFGGTRASFNFLYNPTTVTAEYSISYSDVVGAVLTRQPGDQASPTAPTNNMVSISLLFDRTFELWNGYAPAPQGKATANSATSDGTVSPADPTVYGVGADVFALMQLTGMTTEGQTSAQQNATSRSGATVSPLLGVQGVPIPIPTWMFLGNQDGGLSYYGFVTDFTVTYTHFTQYMVPMRCTIDLDFTLLPQYLPTNTSGFSSAVSADGAWTTAALGQNVATASGNTNAFNGDANTQGPTNGIF